MEEMLRLRQTHKLDVGIERDCPRRHRHRIDEFVAITLHAQPRTLRRAHCGKIPSPYRRRNGDQQVGCKISLRLQGHPGTEGKAAEPQRQLRPLTLCPLHHRPQILKLAAPLVVDPRRCTHTAEIEPHGDSTGCTATPRQGMHNLVGQRTTEQGMRMAAHCQRTRRDALPRQIDDELDLSRRPGN